MSATPAEAATESTAAALLPFPNTWKASLSHWWSLSSNAGITAQNALVRRGLEGTGIPLLDYDNQVISGSLTGKGAEDKIAKLRKIQLDPSSKEQYLNVLEVGPRERQPGEQAFLVLHGYGGAFSFYWQNLATLCGFPNTRLYFMDMLGMGLSGRPKFPSIKVKDPQSRQGTHERVEKAEKFFVDSFEQFAVKEKLKSFTMVGHSMGGYLSTAYAIRYPERVNKLVLVSPVGVPRSPYTSDEEEEAHATQERKEVMDQDFERDQLDTTQSNSDKQTEFKPKPQGDRPKAPNTWWTKLWEANVSPFSIVRLSSFAGPKLVSRYAARRFALFEPEVQKDLFDYLYGVYGQRGSGEYCLAHLLSPGAYARYPLIDRFKQLNANIPVTFIYGDSDWMDKQGGKDAANLLKSRPDASPLMKSRTKVVINPHAGHWVFLDNPEGMNRIFTAEMKEALEDNASSQ